MNPHRGFTLLEVLIALVLVSISLLGLAGLQIKSQQAQIEAFQRSQALLLLNDITSRINLNREARRCYVTSDAQDQSYTVGAGAETFPDCTGFGSGDSQAIANQDIDRWDELLDGASEILAGQEVGGLVGARGCITFNPVDESITAVIAWQGEVVTGAPAEACGQGQYGDERLRRTLSKTIEFAELG